MPHFVKARDPLAQAIIARESELRSKRANWETLWQNVARYVLPREATFTEKVTAGHERNRQILDSTAPRALETFASFLHTLMNNPSQQWFSIRVAGPGQDRPNVTHQKWLEAAGKTTLRHMVNAKIYEHLHRVFFGLGAFGTAVLYVEYLGGLRIRQYHLGDCVIEEGEAGEIDALYRQMMLTPRQAFQRWGDRAGATVMKALDSHGSSGQHSAKKIRFIHATFPSDEPQLGSMVTEAAKAAGIVTTADLGSDIAPFASVWVNAEDHAVVSIGRYFQFPYMAPRWYQSSDELYGRSPAMSVLPSIRMANRMFETILRGAEKLVDPPLMIPQGALLSPLRLFPGSITFSDGQVQPQPLVPPGASRIEVGDALLRRTQEDIERGFFVPLFADPQATVKTATQVLQEADERNRAISPMLMRTQAELYNPLIRRVFSVLNRAGVIEDAPGDLDGDLDVEYVSPLVASQRQIEGLSLLRLFEGLAPWQGIDTGAFDHFDVDKVAKLLHRSSGAPAEVLRTETQVGKVRQARQEQEAQVQQLQALESGAGAAADLITASAKAQR